MRINKLVGPLVNGANLLDKNYIPLDIVKDSVTGILINRELLEKFNLLNNKIKEINLKPLIIISGFRSYNYQKEIFNKKLMYFINQGLTYENSYKKTKQIVAYPGSSEHQTGLAIDITSRDLSTKSDPLIEEFDTTLEGQWLAKNAYKFGFIQRYPKDKTNITGIIYEPWHYRYVGYDVARYISYKSITLEEYVAKVNNKVDKGL